MDMPELEKKLATLSKRSVVTWLKVWPNKLDYASQEVVDRLKKVARGHGIELRLELLASDNPEA
jgi:hypothetical protein